jgi:hypothetical protein
MAQRHFYATADDLLPVFQDVEQRHTVVYSLMGSFESPQLAAVHSGAILPTLREPLADSNLVSCPDYLVTMHGTEVHVERRPQTKGGVRYLVDQLLNPDSVTLSHGGFFSDDVLLYGRVATVSKTKVAAQLHKAFCSSIAKRFTRVRAFYVGPNAIERWKHGCRLTIGANSPREADLAASERV